MLTVFTTFGILSEVPDELMSLVDEHATTTML
jgi:hypothetical protein